MPHSGSVMKRFASLFHRSRSAGDKKSPDPEPGSNTIEESTTKEGFTRQTIITCLLSPMIQKIGVWGMAGIGKTNNVKFVLEVLQAANLKLFDYIFFVSVSYKGSLRSLRNDIGKELGLSNLEDEEDEDIAAKLLYSKLLRKKFLFVLDDLWERVNLEDLGVPQPTQENGCKLLVVTRNRKVCDLMETQVDLLVPPFSEVDSWESLYREAGYVVQQPTIQPIAKRILDECGCLPLAIKVIGEALNGKTDEAVWLKMLGDLMHCRPVKQTWEKLFSRVKLSYDRLETEVLRNCFLALCFYASDSTLSANSLTEYWIMEGYIDFTEEMTLAQIFSKAVPLINELKDASLLEICDKGEIIKTHTILKDMGLLTKSNKFIIMSDQGLLEVPDKEVWEQAEKISLKKNHIESLHQKPSCPNLTSLNLYDNPSLSSISSDFFADMPELRFLDMSLTRINSIPESFCNLVKLRSLDLGFNRCLKNITHIGALKQLLVLDISATPIEELPVEIGELTQLRRLRLYATIHLKRIANGIISKLCNLELLHMRESSYAWRSEAPSKEACLKELLSLTRLSDASLVVRSVDDFDYLYRNALIQAWADDFTLSCDILELSARMSFDATTNKWKTEFEAEDMAARLLSGAASRIGNYDGFFNTL